MKHRIVTPDGATIEFAPAGLTRRFLAALLDALIISAATGSVRSILGSALPNGIAYATAAFFAVFAAVSYGAVCDLRFDGRTLGKRWQSLRTVDDRGGVLTLPQSVVRNVARAVDFLPAFYGVGACAMILDRRGRRLGDRIAGTLVIDERSAATHRVPSMKVLLETSLARAEVRRKARDLTSEERDFLAALLSRESILNAQARFDLFEEAGAHFRRRLRLPGVDALSGENFLKVVASALAEPEAGRSALKSAR